MRQAIVYIRGLNTHAESDWCGIRSFVQSMAALLGADLIAPDYDDYAGVAGLDALNSKNLSADPKSYRSPSILPAPAISAKRAPCVASERLPRERDEPR